MPGSLSAADTLLSQLSGWWDEGVEQDILCAEGRARHRIVVDTKGETLTFEFNKPRKSYDGREHQRARYKILRTSATTATLALENEARRTREGLPVVWELVLVSPEQYRWHATHLPEGTYSNVVGKRCIGKG